MIDFICEHNFCYFFYGSITSYKKYKIECKNFVIHKIRQTEMIFATPNDENDAGGLNCFLTISHNFI